MSADPSGPDAARAVRPGSGGLAWRDRLLGLRDRASDLRNRLLASPRFQRLATRLPVTRPVARRRARSLFDLCAGFVYSQTLLACVELRVLERLAEEPRDADGLGQAVGLAPDAAERLLRASASLGLVERRRGGRFGLGPLGAAFLGNPGVRAMVEHHRLLYRDLADPVALLRGEAGATELARFWAYASGVPHELRDADVADYSSLMAASQSLIADQILDARPLDDRRCLLDVGGGDGTFLSAVAARAPHLRLVLFDLPAVAARARARLTDEAWAERVTTVGGDFFRDPLPEGADAVTLVRILHDHDDAQALAILRAVRRALPPDGVLLLAEPLAGTAGAEPVGDAYFGFYLLAMGSGRARTAAEIEGLLGSAGFAAVRVLRTRLPLQTGLLEARPGPGGTSHPRASSRGSASRNQGV